MSQEFVLYLFKSFSILSECLVVLELPFINYDCSAGSLLIKSCCTSLAFKWIPCEHLMNFLWSSYAVLLKFFWNSSEILMKFLWSSYEVLMILIKLWSKFGDFLLNFIEFHWISSEFLWISSEFLMNFLCSSYAVLTQFLRSSYAVLM